MDREEGNQIINKGEALVFSINIKYSNLYLIGTNSNLDVQYHDQDFQSVIMCVFKRLHWQMIHCTSHKAKNDTCTPNEFIH